MKAAHVRMNQCVCGASAGEPCHGRGLPQRSRHHKERADLARVVAGLRKRRAYVDCTTTPGMWTFPARTLSDGTPIARMEGRWLTTTVPCEHCDGERSLWVRTDALRGQICPLCDDSLDAMYEGADGTDVTKGGADDVA